MRRLAVIYVEYDNTKYSQSFERLANYLEKIKRFQKTFIIVNNKVTGNQFKVIGKNKYFLQGDNTEREFSGWQRGLDFLYEQKVEFDIVLFANEVFEVLEKSYLSEYANDWILYRSLIFRSVIGKIDRHKKRHQILGYKTKSWVCTNCFFVPKAIIDKLGSIITVDKVLINDFLEMHYSAERPVFKPTAPMNGAGKTHFTVWLTEQWRSKLTLDEQSWNTFREKTKAILNEELLSARVRKAGFLILPYNIHQYYISGVRKVILRTIKRNFREAVHYITSLVKSES